MAVVDARSNSRISGRISHLAVGERPFADFQAQITRCEGFKVTRKSPRVWPIAASHLKDIAKTPRCYDTYLAAFAFQNGVGTGGCTVHDSGNLGEIAFVQNALDQRNRLVINTGREFADAAATGGFINKEQVGKGATDINADQSTRATHASATRASRAISVASSSTRPSDFRMTP